MEIELSKILDTQPRREHGNLEDLKKSIQEVGLINPLTINQNNKLLAGRRRFQALQELNWKKAPVRILQSGNELFDFRVALDENLKRKDLRDVEITAAIKEYDEMKRGLEGERKPGGKGGVRRTSTDGEGWSQERTAKDLGISRSQVTEAIKIARAVEEKPELAKLKGKQILRKLKIEGQKEKIKQLKKPTGLFDVIVIDPPWEHQREYDPDFARSSGDYPPMEMNEIKKIKLPMKKDCVVWLWITNNILREGFEVLDSWGLTYRTILTWDKEIIGIGSWLRNQTEQCLMATQGKPIINLTNQPTIIREKRSKHSSKPERFYELMNELCIGEKIDYFSRKERNGWVCYGDEI